jgi:hypothetical protein
LNVSANDFDHAMLQSAFTSFPSLIEPDLRQMMLISKMGSVSFGIARLNEATWTDVLACCAEPIIWNTEAEQIVSDANATSELWNSHNAWIGNAANSQANSQPAVKASPLYILLILPS